MRRCYVHSYHTYEMTPIGISCPDGSGVELNKDFSTLTTAPNIQERITITVER